jgi:hypothetical protein
VDDAPAPPGQVSPARDAAPKRDEVDELFLGG